VQEDPWAGSEAAGRSAIDFGELYGRYAHLVFRRCWLLLGNRADAEDALQEVFLRAMRAAAGFRGESAPMTWLYRISTNHCLNVRRRKDAPVARPEELPDDLLRTLPRAEDLALVRELLPRFDDRTQRAAVAYFVDEMSLEETAACVGRSVPTVRKLLERFVASAGKHARRGGEG
jgi:RNA polymerase sigma-70 factor (ECF subfamily)